MPSNAARAKKVHTEAIVLDAHGDSLQPIVIDGVDFGKRRTGGQADLPRFKQGGIDAQIWAVWVDTIYLPYHAVKRAMQQIDAFHALMERYPSRVELARTASDVRRISRKGKLACLLAIEGGDAIQCDLGILRMYHRMGASLMTLTHSRTTDWADSSTDAPRWNGLNDFGRQVIREMNRLRMVVDVSHVSDATVEAVLEVSKQPIVASHSSCKAISNHPRNLTDDLLRAIAKKGGVIGINFYNQFLDPDYHRGVQALHRDLLSELNRPPEVPPERLDQVAADRIHNFGGGIKLPRPPFERILEHIDHVANVAGIDHVGLGGDLDSTAIPLPEGMDSVADYPKITRGLVERGYSDRDIKKILGENFLRVFSKVTEG